MPASVRSTADPSQSYISTQYGYPEGPSVVAESSWRMAPSWGFEMSFVVILEKATIAFDLTRTPAFRVLPAEGEPFTPEVPGGDGYSHEVEHFARVLDGEPVEPVITPEQARDTIRLVLAEKQSAREGKHVDL